MAARVALKRLARQLGLVEKTQSDRTIETFGPDDQRPCLAESGLYCSVSHDSRMVVAVAHNHPIGVDLEVISNKALRVLNSFWVGREKDLILASPLGPERAATLAWTAKEAAAKALGLNLVQALQRDRNGRSGRGRGADQLSRKDLSGKAGRRRRAGNHPDNLRRSVVRKYCSRFTVQSSNKPIFMLGHCPLQAG